MPRPRCCDDPANLVESYRPELVLCCCACGTVLATASARGELFADY